jgi:CRP/FNR family cyclic AMP-dependent transcriptional regulator
MSVDELRTVPILTDVSAAALERVASCGGEIVAAPGQVLAVPGDPGSGMFILLEGRVEIETRGGKYELGPGAFVGELALLNPEMARVARVRALTDVRCIGIPRDDALELIESEPTLALAMLRELARRLSDAMERG